MSEEELMTTDDLAEFTKTPASRWHKARLTGDTPPYIKLGHLVRYRRGDVLRWLAEQPVMSSTAQAAA
jgi:hypothetical protein